MQAGNPDPIEHHPLPQQIRFVPRHLVNEGKEIPKNTPKIVSKMAWVSCPSGSKESIEAEMLQDCGEMFGVQSYFSSAIIHHKEALPAHNHFFLYGAEPWPLFKSNATNYVKDYRILLGHLSQFAGDCLSTVSKRRELFIAVSHAQLGERCMSLN